MNVRLKYALIFFISFTVIPLGSLYGQFQRDVDLWLDEIVTEQVDPISIEVDEYKIQVKADAYASIFNSSFQSWYISINFIIYKNGLMGDYSAMVGTREYVDYTYRAFVTYDEERRVNITDFVDYIGSGFNVFQIPNQGDNSNKEIIKFYTNLNEIEFRLYKNKNEYIEFEIPQHRLFFNNLLEELNEIEVEIIQEHYAY